MKVQNIDKIVENIKKRSRQGAENYLKYKLKNNEIEGFEIRVPSLEKEEKNE